METPEQKKVFSLVARMKSFTHAGRGIRIFIMSTHNAWVHLVVAGLVIVTGILKHITLTDWALLIFAIGFVLVAEAFNTAIEVDIDLTSPNFHPYARDTKDVAAGAVLMASITAVVIGCIVFVPKFF
jgi:diacylglycerol kinase (ATP)